MAATTNLRTKRMKLSRGCIKTLFSFFKLGAPNCFIPSIYNLYVCFTLCTFISYLFHIIYCALHCSLADANFPHALHRCVILITKMYDLRALDDVMSGRQQ